MPAARANARLQVSFNEEKIDALFAPFDRCGQPGVAVAVAIGGTPVYRKAFGLASQELPLCLTPSTRLRIGSATKSFTSLACMLLCEDGRATPDDPIGKYLPELSATCRRATLRQIMGNISGLRDALGLISQFRGHIDAHVAGRPTSADEVLSLYRDMNGVDAPPRATFIYNNGAYFLLSLVIERIAGQPFAEVVDRRICRPLGLYDTQVRPWDSSFLPNSASTHQLDTKGCFVKAAFGYDYAGAGAIVSTLNDMLRWLANMDSQVVGNAATWSAIKTPQTLVNGTCSGYGMGLRVGRYRGIDTLFHGGGWVGSQTQMLKVPAAALDIMIMANRNDAAGPALLDRMLDCLLPGLGPAPVPFAGPFLRGTFHSATTGRVIQLFERGGCQMVSVDGWDLAIQPDDRGTFWPPDKQGFMKWGITPLGNAEHPAALRFSDFGNVDDLSQVEPATSAWPQQVCGRYRSDETDFEVDIHGLGQGAELTTSTRFGSMDLALDWLGERLWRSRCANSMSAVLVFDREWQRFRYSDPFTRGLRFRRLA